ncbi:MAG: mechanosensitive ion channel domain-containing protein [Dehalococcoidales bacterium]|jgi:small-conductance mechanosensitive channel
MVKNAEIEKLNRRHVRPVIITFSGTILMIILILATLDVSHRNVAPFITNQQKYILAIEAAGLAVFMVELALRLATLRLHTPKMEDQRNRIRLMVRIVGYTISAISVISILASNATLGISAGAILGVVIAFATQNIVGSMLAAIIILSTRMVRVGEEITVNQTKGVIAEINLTHTVLSVGENVVFVPNSMVISNIVQRQKRTLDKDAGARDW